MIKVGITGGIGSGKSTVSKLLKMLSIPVYIADIESKKLTETSPLIKAQLIESFGEDLYKNDVLDKKLFASHIFSDKKKLSKANAIIHPEVNKHFVEWCDNLQDLPIIGLETAILFESGMQQYIDKIVMVYTPKEERIRRVIQRDNTTREKVLERINNQLSDEEKVKQSDYIIQNDELTSLIEQCIELIQKIYDRR